MIKLRNLLLENPDSILLKDKILNHWDTDVVTFGYYKSEIMVAVQFDVNNTKNSVIHTMLPPLYGHAYMTNPRKNLFLPGRLWYNSKVISLWNAYPSRDELDKLITDIKNELREIINGKPIKVSIDSCKTALSHMKDFNINSKTWNIEMVGDNMTNISYRRESELLPLLLYKNEHAEKQFADVDHVKSPMIKQSNVPDGVGSRNKKYGDETATQHFQKKYTSEIKK